MKRHPQPGPRDEDLVRALVSSQLGLHARALRRQTYGHGSVTWAVDTDGRTVFVRTTSDPELYRNTSTNLKRLAALGLPVPEVLACDLSTGRYPFAYVVTDAFAGRDVGFEITSMTRPQVTTLAHRVVAAQRSVGELPLGHGFGFGPVDGGGPHRSWLDAILADRVVLDSTAPFAVRVRQAVERAAARLSRIEPICFLDDLTTKNVIVHDGRLSGFVDFDVVCFGDPMYWLALTQVAMLSDVGRPSEFYVQQLRRLWNPSELESSNLALYSAVHAVEFLRWCGDDTEVGPRMRAALEAWLADRDRRP